jgi:hypothetical protein
MQGDMFNTVPPPEEDLRLDFKFTLKQWWKIDKGWVNTI